MLCFLFIQLLCFSLLLCFLNLFFQLCFLFLEFPFYFQNCLFFFRRCYPYDIYFFLIYVFEHLKQNCFHVVLFSTGFNMWIPLLVETPGFHGGLFPWEFQILDFDSIFRLNCFWTCVMIQGCEVIIVGYFMSTCATAMDLSTSFYNNFLT